MVMVVAEQADTSQVLLQLVAAYQLLWVEAQAHILITVVLQAAAVILDLLRVYMVAREATTTVQPVVTAAAVAALLLDTVQVAVPAAKAIPAPQVVIIGQAMEAAEHLKQGKVCKVDLVLAAQSPVLV
jgi:hypothetical protein